MRQPGWGNNDGRREPEQEPHSPTAWMTTRVLDPRCGADDGSGRMTGAIGWRGRVWITNEGLDSRCDNSEGVI